MQEGSRRVPNPDPVAIPINRGVSATLRPSVCARRVYLGMLAPLPGSETLAGPSVR